MGVFNGDTGILKEINEFAETATVEFEDGRFADYSFKQLEELELAYAITIHKSQGSEYPAVILPLLSAPQDADEPQSFVYRCYKSTEMCYCSWK